MAMRRFWVRRKRQTSQAIWPINESAGFSPPDWPGWPNGKKFAVVLTHDVEAAEGVVRCKQLAELETRIGFRSSFNFVPEGDYSLPSELQDWLVQRGFEVGVHDLEHDGRLFSSRLGFERKASRINSYLRDWRASGFRSGFMLRNLDWMHELNIDYDLSTFDTDPFEPQPEAAGTIFPFFVPPPSGLTERPGFVELPYTLPQDSTLFLLLREPTNDIWRNKVDWIASKGGMVLINVHPDYLRFQGSGPGRMSIEDHYADLLSYIAQKYGKVIWQALPREISAFTRKWYGRAVVQGRNTV